MSRCLSKVFLCTGVFLLKMFQKDVYFFLFWWDKYMLKQTGLLTAGLAPLHHRSLTFDFPFVSG